MNTRRGLIWSFLGLVLAAQSCAQIGGFDEYQGSSGISGGADGAVTGAPCTDGKNCESGVCKNSACAPALCDDGVKNGLETDRDCGGPHCSDCADMKACIGSADCASGVCIQGTCTAPTCDDGAQNGDEVDVDCGAQACQKGCENSKHCGADDDCVSNLCLNATCQIPECTDGVKNANETDIDCGPGCDPCELGEDCKAAGDCATQFCEFDKCATKIDGSECGADVQCASGYCVDGYCCESACDTACRVCNAEGKCVNAQPEAQDALCDADTSKPCDNTGVCAADGTCAKASTTEPCSPAMCNGTTLSLGLTCDGMGNCPMPMTVECSPFLCKVMGEPGQEQGECTTGCMMDADCAANGYCDSIMGMMGTCFNKQPKGGACTEDRGCQGNNKCVDGVCCDNECTITCQACNVEGSEGTCVDLPIGDQDLYPMNACNGTKACNGGSGSAACLKKDGEVCAVGLDCASNHCVDGVCCNETCTGTCKACNVVGSVGTCSNMAKGTDDSNSTPACSGATQACDGAGVCKKDIGQVCSNGSECALGFCVDGVCCSAACTETCKACNVVGSVGTCSNTPKGSDDVTTCTSTTLSCDGNGACKKDNSQTCTANAECVSGFCADGVCCSAACTEVCKACNVAGSIGTCSNTPKGSDDVTTCTSTTLSCDGSGSCKKDPGQPCMMGSECTSNVCTGNVCQP